MTILHTEASRGWGGQEIRILNEMLGIKSRGYEVLLATQPDSSIYGRARERGIKVMGLRMDAAHFIPSALALRNIIKQNNVKIINTHSSKDSWIGSIAGRLAGVKVLRTRHISSKLNKGRLTRLVYGPLCDRIITTGKFIRNQIIDELALAPDKVRSIPTGIDIERFKTADGAKIRSELGIASHAPVLGIAAVLRSWKGHSHLISAMPDILSAFPDARLMIVGDGPRRARIELEKRELGLGESVILTGHREDIPEVISSFDIAVIASYASEGIPQFALQAMASGRPVVGTKIGGIPEVIHHDVNGLLVDSGNPLLIANAVKTLLGNPEKMKRMGEAGRRMAVEGHTTGKMLDSLEALYGSILR